jgi:hypothetical protein
MNNPTSATAPINSTSNVIPTHIPQLFYNPARIWKKLPKPAIPTFISVVQPICEKIIKSKEEDNQ